MIHTTDHESATTPLAYTEIPKYPDGRNDWQTLMDGVKEGDELIVPMNLRARATNSANDRGFRVRTTEVPGRDAVRVIIIAEHEYQRTKMLQRIRALSTGQIKALYEAAKKSGIIKERNKA
jgi:hypothetical protein